MGFSLLISDLPISTDPGLVSRSQTLYLTATLGKGLVALVHSTSSIPSQGKVEVPVVVVSNLGIPQPLNLLFFTVPRLTRMYYGQWNLLQIR